MWLYEVDGVGGLQLLAELVNWGDTDGSMGVSSFGTSCSLDRNGTTLIVGAPDFSPTAGLTSEGGIFIYHKDHDSGLWEAEYNFTER